MTMKKHVFLTAITYVLYAGDSQRVIPGVYLTESGRRTAVSQRALKYIYFYSRGPDDRAGRPAR